MKIIDELLSTLDYEASVRDIQQGPFQTAVLTHHCGLASTPHDSGPHHNRTPVVEVGLLVEKDAKVLAHIANSENPFEAVIGMAAINSLIGIDDTRCTEANAGDLLVRKGEGKRVAMVGHFPFVPRLRSTAKELWVIERESQEGDFTGADSDRFLPQADVIGITGTTFTNHSLEGLLSLCNPNAYVVVLVGTTHLSPMLSDYSINVVSGTQVIKSKTVLRCISQGATFRQIKGIRLLAMGR